MNDQTVDEFPAIRWTKSSACRTWTWRHPRLPPPISSSPSHSSYSSPLLLLPPFLPTSSPLPSPPPTPSPELEIWMTGGQEEGVGRTGGEDPSTT